MLESGCQLSIAGCQLGCFLAFLPASNQRKSLRLNTLIISASADQYFAGQILPKPRVCNTLQNMGGEGACQSNSASGQRKAPPADRGELHAGGGSRCYTTILRVVSELNPGSRAKFRCMEKSFAKWTSKKQSLATIPRTEEGEIPLREESRSPHWVAPATSAGMTRPRLEGCSAREPRLPRLNLRRMC